jgi:hypothetical protein
MQEEIQKFLKLTNGSQETCLMIAENEKDFVSIKKEIANSGFKKSQNIREIFNSIKDGKKTYFTLNDNIGNNIYNIIAQYPTGQVTAYDGQNNLVANPDYKKGSVLILITKENLEKIEQGEKSLLKLAGLTWKK